MQAVNGNGDVRNLSVTTAAGVTTIRATDAYSGATVTRFAMGESQLSELKNALGSGSTPASAGDPDGPVYATNSEGGRDVTVESDGCGHTVLVARVAGSRRVRVRLNMRSEDALNLAAALTESAS